ncbi:MAG: hypothetical protein KC503_23460 [Myxococcales bacterium]|nr:hypothetical protein [Myxococcales bacterium]
MTSKQRIRIDFKSFIARLGGGPDQWYVGVSRDARRRMFEEHGVHETRDTWIIRRASSAAEARELERYFVDVLGTAGGPGCCDASTDKCLPRPGGAFLMIYAYRRGTHTRP